MVTAAQRPAFRPASRPATGPKPRLASRADTLAGLRNLGPQSQRMLTAAGIDTPRALQRLGAVAAYRRVQAVVPAASLNLLYALVGALEDEDWRDVRRTRKLALLMALEAAPPPKTRRAAGTDSLLALRNIGPAMRHDLERLGVHTAAQLARHDPDRLYRRLESLTGARQDPCVWDTFAAAIHQARTGEALPWWHFTAERKRRMAEGGLVAGAARSPGKTRSRR